MSRTLQLLPDCAVFEVRYSGPLTYAERRETVDELERRLRGSWIKRLLIDFTSAWPAENEPPGEETAFRARLCEVTYPRGARVAVVNAPAEHGAASEETSGAAGFRVRRFYDRAHALAWLVS
jgi:hypothetical protein